MKGFLTEIADELLRQYGDDMGKVTLVFPNRRAGLFLRQILRNRTKKAVWAPEIISFRDFIERESGLTVPDSLYLIFQLYQVYRRMIPHKEAFEEFYFWGQMLLRDFDEIDKYLIHARQLYTDLSRQKELDAAFDYLTPEQQDLIRQFWRGFDSGTSSSQEEFLRIWKKLYDVYSGFREVLANQGYAYEGALYRDLAERIDQHTWQYKNDVIWFAGFNALTAAEERIIKYWLSDQSTRIFWDVDAYYSENRNQEAGRFFRMHRRDPRLSGTFPPEIPSRIGHEDQHIRILGVPQFVGQAKVCGEILAGLLNEKPELSMERIAIVLADETLLLPVLHSLPEKVGAINITMGFPLSFAPLSGFIEQLAELQTLSRQDEEGRRFHYRQIMAVENHPMMTAYRAADNPWTRRDGQRLYWNEKDLAVNPVYELIFRSDQGDFVAYLIRILEELSAGLHEDIVTASHIHYFLRHLYRYSDLMDGAIGVDMFRRLFRQLVRLDKIPFTGEPLEGLQIMGVLETRNLDFDHLFVLGMNEESFPAGRNMHSYIPYNLRKAYDLPHRDQQDAIYAYLFYRLLHNCRNAVFTYNTEGDELGGEEMSRFLKQLIYEKPVALTHELVNSAVNVGHEGKISFHQSDGSLKQLSRFLDGEEARPLSPSAVNTYMDCSLKFYFRYVAHLYEIDELEDNVDARTLGSLIHEGVETLYTPFLYKEVTEADIRQLEDKIEDAVIAGFRKQYNIPDEESFELEGKNVIAKEVASKYLRKILERDLEYAPFVIRGLEEKVVGIYTLQDGRKVMAGGSVDRIDEKEGMIRIVDFKTGTDERKFNGSEGLIGEKRTKAAFQTFYYAMLYSPGGDQAVVPAVYNRNVLFQGEDPLFEDTERKSVVDSVSEYSEFKNQVRQVIENIFDPRGVFDQTDDLKICEKCPYNQICQRV